LGLVAIGAIAFKAWWREDHTDRENAGMQTQLGQLESNQAGLARSIDSLRTATRVTLDSIRQSIEFTVTPAPTADSALGKPADAELQAEQAWDEAVRGLPKDLTAYERKVAEQELKESVRKRYELSKEQIDAIVRPR
jgi:hypothetical protein